MNCQLCWILLGFVALVAPGPGKLCAQPSTLPPMADADTRAGWKAWITGQDRLRITHVERFRRPAPFDTRKRSDLEIKYRHEDVLLSGPAARDILAFLGGQLDRATEEPAQGCPSDTLAALDEITLELWNDVDTLLAKFEPQRGTLTMMNRRAMHWSPPADSSQGRLLDLLADRMADDPRLGSIRRCDTATPAPPPGDDPSAGDVVLVETFPEIMKRDPTEYPEVSRREGLEATIMVHALVGRDGLVERTLIEYVSPAAYPFQRSAVRSVEKYEFKPATTSGRPIAVWVAVPIRFVLR